MASGDRGSFISSNNAPSAFGGLVPNPDARIISERRIARIGAAANQ